ncbi:putative F-box domain-containing protein [Rosa chinensis]|uniref:Putative F-box domain-containing protein n=1 Tax=Rosa chinensis TaxID=74649 RepID=A0A2P6PQE4_ROSCH|nr:putative F-box domain-containing protein [Rosa chinensis]
MDHSGILAQTEGESNDGINGLPNCILSSILSLLTIKDAVDTSMISRQWKHRWLDPVLTRPNLELDIPNIFGSRYAGPYCKYDPGHHLTLLKQFNRLVFVRRVNTVLDLYRGRKIDSFKVSFLLDGQSTKILDGWIGFAIRKGS